MWSCSSHCPWVGTGGGNGPEEPGPLGFREGTEELALGRGCGRPAPAGLPAPDFRETPRQESE